jgi:hypothetical protein
MLLPIIVASVLVLITNISIALSLGIFYCGLLPYPWMVLGLLFPFFV